MYVGGRLSDGEGGYICKQLVGWRSCEWFDLVMNDEVASGFDVHLSALEAYAFDVKRAWRVQDLLWVD